MDSRTTGQRTGESEMEGTFSGNRSEDHRSFDLRSFFFVFTVE